MTSLSPIAGSCANCELRQGNQAMECPRRGWRVCFQVSRDNLLATGYQAILTHVVDLCSTVEEVNVKKRRPGKLHIFVKRPSGTIGAPYKFHHIYRVVLRFSGEVWAVDPTGAQSGNSEPLYSWQDVESEKHHAWTIHTVSELGANQWTALSMMACLGMRKIRDHLAQRIFFLGLRYCGQGGELEGDVGIV
ncbi:hypothetical protein VTO42DRAFT_1502 [Malbranchea cinnamomea]